ncbi:PfaD family polyunsaturated fatty acid/polyketide biosynthesis protein [Streptomyces sp. CA-181903]|uniref:PfaD family polyunsaturated fatty acid/polyketide biosynthesis protein n=1 Tax=Streptomyces sp. CA-181903 TaxID=3240055 RepID=UPI003D905F4B
MTVRHDPDGVYSLLAAAGRPCHVVRAGGRVGATDRLPAPGDGTTVLASAGPLPPEALGSAGFRRDHGVRHAYMAGAMAGGIASEELVAALARDGWLASFGSAGLPAARLAVALERLERELGRRGLPFACNLIHSPMAPAMERVCVDLCLRHGVRCVEASAFVQLTPELVRYRVTGLAPGRDGGVRAAHRLVAKVSRPETAALFLRPAPESLLDALLAAGSVTAGQARLARAVPMADDVTVEADSGGHTDRRPLAVALPEMLRLRDRLARELPGGRPVRVGAAGGIGTPDAAMAAFALGADYVVTGSVNQAATEAGTSAEAKALLAEAGPADCVMAPSADLFEQGVQVQVLGRGTMFAGRAARLLRLYHDHAALSEIPPAERRHLEERLLRRPLTEVWRDTAAYLREHDPDRLRRAEEDPKCRMAAVFRWYLAMGSRWAVTGETGRRADWQIWCGPAMGAFNAWAAGSALADPARRSAVAVATHLMRGAAFEARVAQLRLSGVRLPAACARYRLPPALPAAPPPAAPAVRGGWW